VRGVGEAGGRGKAGMRGVGEAVGGGGERLPLEAGNHRTGGTNGDIEDTRCPRCLSIHEHFVLIAHVAHAALLLFDYYIGVVSTALLLFTNITEVSNCFCSRIIRLLLFTSHHTV
jgi:hypothetical protein